MTFGYSANWRGASKSISSITDFAKELLFEMRFAKGTLGTDLCLGTNPIIFVAHSMGGLVVKKACLLGIHDENYKHVIQSVSAIVFLSTPHRGTHLAKVLNRLLAVSFQSSKNFISDLNKSSPTIEEINEQFRHLAPKLTIWSFYETRPTSIGPKKVMVLEKDSSVLGYPAEISRPLEADHHDVCKFSNRSDLAYISIKNAIQSLVASGFALQTEAIRSENMTNLEELFRNSPSSEADYNGLRRCQAPDTCKWFLKEPEVVSWVEPSPQPRILWYNALPGSGKSVLSTFMIDYLLSSERECQFFLFRYSDHNKRSVAGALLALAFQLARSLPKSRERLSGSSSESLGIEPADPLLIWRNVFENALFQTGRPDPVYWVIDALDECDSPKAFLECLQGLSDATLPVRVLILSRNTDSISLAFDRLSHTVPVFRIDNSSRDHNQQDIELFVKQELGHMRGTDPFKQQLMQSLMARSQGNFLWTRLVLDEIIECHTEDSVWKVLETFPDDMKLLYQHMELVLVSATRESNKPLIRALLEWVICAQRPLSLDELSHALKPEFSGFLDLRRTIKDACGQFIQVNNSGQTDILHHTAREYFTSSSESQFYIDSGPTHEKLLTKTLAALQDTGLRWRLIQNQNGLRTSEPFVFYAAANWAYHLRQINMGTPESLDIIVRFFQSPAVLVWIHVLALLRRLEVLAQVSEVVASLARDVGTLSASNNEASNILSHLALLDDWIVDLVQLVAKFGRNLLTKPGVVYNVIPALCPEKSAIYRQFYSPDSTLIKILGTRDSAWNDNLACLALPGDANGLSITCVGKYLAVLSSEGNVYIWDPANFMAISTISHKEHVTAMALSQNGGKLATYGVASTKIWSVHSGRMLSSTVNPPRTNARAIDFAENDRTLLFGGDDNNIWQLRCDDPNRVWQILHPNLLKDTGRVEGAIFGSPVCISFNGDKTWVGVAYRGAPLAVWRIHDGKCINRCQRAPGNPSSTWFVVDRLTWNAVTNHAIGIYRGGYIFKWHPITNENVEKQVFADEIAASPNGRRFATSDPTGTVKVWDFASFRPIFCVRNENLVAAVTFSPDGRRLYDLRGASVIVWASDKVASFDKVDERTNNTNKQKKPSLGLLNYPMQDNVAPQSVTAFALAPDGSSYCIGDEVGIVLLYQKGEQDSFVLVRFNSSLPITCIKWCESGGYVAVSSLAGVVQVKAICQQTPDNPVLPAPSGKFYNGTVDEITFSRDGQLLFISSPENTGAVWSVAEGRVQARAAMDSGSDRKWLCHPTQPDIILGYGVQDVRAYSWKTLDFLGRASYHELPRQQAYGRASKATAPEATDSAQPSRINDIHVVEGSVTKAMLTQDLKHILVSALVQRSGVGTTNLMIIPITALETADEGGCLPPSLGFISIAPHILAQIQVPLGVLPSLELAFLDHDLWVCTYSLKSVFRSGLADSYRRFYFIPRDWVRVGGVNSDSRDNCALTASGTLFWPRDDRVVAIECTLDDRWTPDL